MSKLITPPKLQSFLEKLNTKFGKFIILRGYRSLPISYSNDIDVFVPKQDVVRFLRCLTDLDGLNTSVNILVSRLGLIKCDLVLESETIPFDILYGFYYFGLDYQDCEDLYQKSVLHHSHLFYTPVISDEIRMRYVLFLPKWRI